MHRSFYSCSFCSFPDKKPNHHRFILMLLSVSDIIRGFFFPLGLTQLVLHTCPLCPAFQISALVSQLSFFFCLKPHPAKNSWLQQLEGETRDRMTKGKQVEGKEGLSPSNAASGSSWEDPFSSRTESRTSTIKVRGINAEVLPTLLPHPAALQARRATGGIFSGSMKRTRSETAVLSICLFKKNAKFGPIGFSRDLFLEKHCLYRVRKQIEEEGRDSLNCPVSLLLLVGFLSVQRTRKLANPFWKGGALQVTP